jgi:hypothetical protein
MTRVIVPVNYFLVLTSILVHGITIPVGKGFHMVRTRTLNIISTPTNRSTSIAKKSNIRDFLPFTRAGISPTPTVPLDAISPVQPETLGDRALYQENDSIGASPR